MKKRITLHIDENVLKKVRKLAKEHHFIISGKVEDCLKNLIKKCEENGS